MSRDRYLLHVTMTTGGGNFSLAHNATATSPPQKKMPRQADQARQGPFAG
jgi:hypothetical protein